MWNVNCALQISFGLMWNFDLTDSLQTPRGARFPLIGGQQPCWDRRPLASATTLIGSRLACIKRLQCQLARTLLLSVHRFSILWPTRTSVGESSFVPLCCIVCNIAFVDAWHQTVMLQMTNAISLSPSPSLFAFSLPAVIL